MGATWLITIEREKERERESERECTKSHDRSQYRNHVAENTWRRMPPDRSNGRERSTRFTKRRFGVFARRIRSRPGSESVRSIDWVAAAFATLSIGANSAVVAGGRATDAKRRRGEARDGARRVARKNENRRREYEWKWPASDGRLGGSLAGNSVHTQTL